VEKGGPSNNLITHHSLVVVNVYRAVGTTVAVDSLASELCSVSGNNKTKSNSRITMIGISVEFLLRELNVLLSDFFLINLPVEPNHKTNGTIRVKVYVLLKGIFQVSQWQMDVSSILQLDFPLGLTTVALSVVDRQILVFEIGN
jgi:hypothetical protein